MTFKPFTRLQVIAVAMDVFTDVDIFKEIITATLRGVAVYVLLDQSHFTGFLTMSRRAGINIQDLKVRRQQRRGESFLPSLHHSLPPGMRARPLPCMPAALLPVTPPCDKKSRFLSGGWIFQSSSIGAAGGQPSSSPSSS